jgi:predicted transcriptional regulator of viral defense system
MVHAFGQAGYFTSAQALEVGYSYQAQKYHADHGNWVRVDRGIYRIPDWPAEADDAYVRWSLWSDGRAVVSHETALSVHGLSDLDPARIHLTVDPSFHRRDDAVVLHVAELAADDIEPRDAWSVTTPVRTLVDVAAGVSAQEHIDRAVVDALRTGKASRRMLLRASDGANSRAALRLERAIAASEAQL